MATAIKVPSVYGVNFSTCTRRVLVTLQEKGVENWNLVKIDLAARQQKQPEFLEKQPFGVIPVFEDEDVSIFESRAIGRYVAEKYAGNGAELLGTNLKERALVNQWCEVESQEFNPPVSAVVFEKVIKKRRGLEADEEKVKQNLAKIERVLDVYEKHLGENSYLAGEFFSLADLFHLPYLSHLVNAAGHADLVNSRENVKQWWDKIYNRPSWQKILSLQ